MIIKHQTDNILDIPCTFFIEENDEGHVGDTIQVNNHNGETVQRLRNANRNILQEERLMHGNQNILDEYQRGRTTHAEPQ